MFVVAGVSGHVGSVVAKSLLAAGKKVKVLVRDAKKGESWAKHGAEVATGSLDDSAFVTGALKGAEGFFTLLPPPPYTAPDFFAAQRATADALAAGVKASGVPHVVLLSSIGADLAEGTGPIKGLHYFEGLLHAAGVQLSAIRAGFFQENVGMSVGAAKGAGIYPNFAPSADLAMPMIATKDIGALAAKLLVERPGKSENVDLHGPAYSANDVAAKLGAALGKTVKVVDIPAAGHLAALLEAGLPPTFAAAYTEMYAGFATGNIAPKGDRLVQGSTPLDEVLPSLLG